MVHQLQAFILTLMALSTMTANAAYSATTGHLQVTHDSQYIYIKSATHFTLNDEQSKALQAATQLISTQVGHLTTNFNQSVDPTGDLTALSQAAQDLNYKLDSLTAFATTLYGQISTEQDRWIPWLQSTPVPTGFMIFAGVEFDRNLVQLPLVRNLIQGGGSLTVAWVFVPMNVTRITIADGHHETYTDFDTSLVLIPNVNAGVAVSTTGGGQNRRFGVGLIWGEMDRAADVVGWTGGGSTTVAFPGLLAFLPEGLKANGINMKLLAVKNQDLPGAVTNVIGMIGFEQGLLATANGQLPLTEVDAESHFNISYIFDLSKLLTTATSPSSWFAKAALLPLVDQKKQP